MSQDIKEPLFPPKKCFGNYLYKSCEDHHNCEQSGECNIWTNYFKGSCDCPYKKSCHPGRQRIQAEIREDSKDPDIRKCNFYKYFI